MSLYLSISSVTVTISTVLDKFHFWCQGDFVSLPTLVVYLGVPPPSRKNAIISSAEPQNAEKSGLMIRGGGDFFVLSSAMSNDLKLLSSWLNSGLHSSSLLKLKHFLTAFVDGRV